eukprot:Gb_12960 [translate_table: standard]
MLQMNELKDLNVHDSESLRELPGLGSMKSLTELELRDCTELVLKVSECESLMELPGLRYLKSLTELGLFYCENLSKLSNGTLLGGIIPKWLTLGMQRMRKPEKRGWGEYCVQEDVICKGIVVRLSGVACENDEIAVNISTEDDNILRQIKLPYLRRCHVGIIQEELPSIIKFRSGDIIRCSTTYGTKIVGVYLDKNESGNDYIDIQSNQSLDMDDDSSLKRP